MVDWKAKAEEFVAVALGNAARIGELEIELATLRSPRPIEDDTPTDAGEGVANMHVRSHALEEAAKVAEGLRRQTPYDHNRHPCTTTMKRIAAAIRVLAPVHGADQHPVAWRRLEADDNETASWVFYGHAVEGGEALYAHPTPTDIGLVGELVEALERYGKHDGLCGIIGGYGYCTCGLDKARTALSKAKDTPHG